MTAVIPRRLVAEALGLTEDEAARLPPGDLPVDRLADRYVAYLRETGDAEAPGAHPEFWTYCLFDELARSEPDLCLDAVRASLARCATPGEVALVAAGPLEDLIAEHGDSVIGRIEDAARRSPRMRYALTGVWPRGQEGSLTWTRIEAAREGAGSLDAGDPLPPAG